MIDLDALLPDVLPETPGCPNPLALSAIRNAAGEFLRDTHAWREVFDSITPIQEEWSEYALPIPAGTQILAIVSAIPASGDRKLAILFKPPGALMVRDAGNESFVVTVALGLAPGASEVPGWILGRAGEQIAAGAKHRLLRMPGVEWSNPELGLYYQGIYREGVAEMRVNLLQEFSHGSQRIRPRSFI